LEKFDREGKMVNASAATIEHLFALARERRLLIQAGDDESVRAQAIETIDYYSRIPEEDLLVLLYKLTQSLEAISARLERMGVKATLDWGEAQ